VKTAKKTNYLLLGSQLIAERILNPDDLEQLSEPQFRALTSKVATRKTQLEAQALHAERTARRWESKFPPVRSEEERQHRLKWSQYWKTEAADYRKMARSDAIRLAHVLLAALKDQSCTIRGLTKLCNKTWRTKPYHAKPSPI
jgi:hypothetical protein